MGLDLKETRDVILIEASWNPSQEEQVIGRAIRIGSHDKLPPNESFVDIFHLILTKPHSITKINPYASKTPDEMLYDLTKRKEVEQSKMYKIIKRYAVQ